MGPQLRERTWVPRHLSTDKSSGEEFEYYPSRAAFLEMLADPEYRAAHVHREAGLANTHLIQCDGTSLPE